MESRQKRILGVGLALIIVALVFAQVTPVLKANAKSQDEVVAPASDLPALQNQLASTLYQFETSTDDAESKADPMQEFGIPADRLAQDYAGDKIYSTADLVARDPAFRQEIRRVASVQPFLAAVITPKDILSDRPSRATRVVSRALIAEANQAAEIGDLDRCLVDLQAAYDMAVPIMAIGESPSIVTYFGIHLEVLRTVHEFARRPETTSGQLSRLSEFVGQLAEPVSVTAAFDRNIRELIVAARSIDTFDEYELLTLNAEQHNQGPPPEHPQIREAMEARLAQFWQRARLAADEHPDSERAGHAIDNILLEALKDAEDGNYMVRTQGAVYEQIGRNFTRLAQARQAVRADLYVRQARQTSGKLPEALPREMITSSVGPEEVNLQYEVKGTTYTILAKSRLTEHQVFLDTPFDVNQMSGVRIQGP